MNKASGNLNHLQKEANSSSGPLIRLHVSELDVLMERSGDTWVVLYYDRYDTYTYTYTYTYAYTQTYTIHTHIDTYTHINTNTPTLTHTNTSHTTNTYSTQIETNVLENLEEPWSALAAAVDSEANVAMVDLAESCEEETDVDFTFVNENPSVIRTTVLCKDGTSARVVEDGSMEGMEDGSMEDGSTGLGSFGSGYSGYGRYRYRFESLPQVRLHSGLETDHTTVEPDLEGTIYEGDYLSDNMDKEVRAAMSGMAGRQLAAGSIYTMPVAVQRQYSEAVVTLK
jgi:hypothetical protein